MGFSAGVPFVGQAQMSIEVQAQWGVNQNWGKQTTHQITLTPTLKMNEPGKYRVTGWAEIVDNIMIPFRAKATFTAKGLGFVNNAVDASYDLNSEYIESLIADSKEYDVAKVLARTPTSVVLEVTGKMSGTYGLKSYFKTEKIGVN